MKTENFCMKMQTVLVCKKIRQGKVVPVHAVEDMGEGGA